MGEAVVSVYSPEATELIALFDKLSARKAEAMLNLARAMIETDDASQLTGGEAPPRSVHSKRVAKGTRRTRRLLVRNR
jgi:hypothetical protein